MSRTPISAYAGTKLAYRLFHPPHRPHHRAPVDVGLMASEVTARTVDEIDLHLWLVPGEGRGTAVIGHGIGLTKSASLRQAKLLHDLGYHVALFDHRNHGRSGVDPAKELLAERFSNDIETSIMIAQETWPRSPRLVVWGFSFSTFPTLYSVRHETSPIDAIMCDSGPGLDLDSMLQHFRTAGNLPVLALADRLLRRPAVVRSFAAAAVHMLGAEWPPDPDLTAAGKTPMLYLAGTADEVIPREHIQALAARYPRHVYAELPAGHLQGMKTAPREYEEAVSAFLASLEGDHALGAPGGR